MGSNEEEGESQSDDNVIPDHLRDENDEGEEADLSHEEEGESQPDKPLDDDSFAEALDDNVMPDNLQNENDKKGGTDLSNEEAGESQSDDDIITDYLPNENGEGVHTTNSFKL